MQNELNELNQYRPSAEKVFAVIDSLNDEVAQWNMPPDSVVLEYYGYAGYVIKFLTWVIYSSEEDCRDHDEKTDTYEPLDTHLRRTITEICSKVGQIKL